MTETISRREYLLAVLRHEGGTVTTGRVLRIYSASAWSTAGRPTARRDIRDLTVRGHLLPLDIIGSRTYQLNPHPHPQWWRGPKGRMREELLEVIRREGGEWTTGRTRAVCRRILGAHVLRMTAKRLLADLHERGHLVRRDAPSRRYYVRKEDA
jgi:hypothetical protein